MSRIVTEFTVPLRQNSHKLFIQFETPKFDTTYLVSLEIVNKIDPMPLVLMPCVTEKHREYFRVELTIPPDSSNYELRYKIAENPVSGMTYKYEEPKITFEDGPCNHKWVEYKGFTEKYDFCEHCDTKR